jgi:universal stress protein E
LAAVDPEPDSDHAARLDRRILSFTRDLSNTVGGELDVVHVLDATPQIAAAAMAAPAAGLVALQSDPDEEIERRRRVFERLIDSEFIDEPFAHLVSGDVVGCLTSCAEDLQADVVVMGAVSRTGLQRLLGHTAQRVLEQLPCDVIVVKPDGFVSAVDRS